MQSYFYVDNSNIYIEGTHVSAVRNGLAKDIWQAQRDKISDRSWNIDYGKLHTFLCGHNKSEIGAVRLWGSPPPGDSFWDMVKAKGFDHKTFPRGIDGKEKKVDVAIAHAMTKDAYKTLDKAKNDINLVAGDKDYVPVVEDLVKEGFKVHIVFWDHAAKELKLLATSFTNLNPFLEHVGYYKS